MGEQYRILTVDELRVKLQFHNITKVANAVGMTRQGIYKIIRGETDPRLSSVQALSKFLSET
jgi:DNA-binding phage protein